MPNPAFPYFNSLQAAQAGTAGFVPPFAGGTGTGGNFAAGGIIPGATAQAARKKAKRIYAPVMGALSAENALLDPTLQLTGRAGEGYAGLFAQIAPQYVNAYRNANPDTAALLAQLTQGARDLNAPGYMNPYEDRLLQQSVRSAQSARGMGYGQGDALNEILALDRNREARTLARGQYGIGVTEAGRQFYSPIIAGVMSQYQNPVQGTSLDDLVSIGLNDTAARRNEHAARVAGNQALWGSVIQGVLGVASAGAKACWVAEVLYGVDDPRTHRARAWVLSHPENAFVQAYQKHGKAWARWLERNSWARPFVQPVWDAMWKAT